MTGAAENDRPEIVFAWNYLEWGGGQIYFLGIMRGAVRRGYRVKAVMPRGTGEKLLGYFKSENIAVEFFEGAVDLSKAANVWHKARRRLRDARSYLALARHLSRQNPAEKIIQIDAAPWAGYGLLRFLIRKTHVFVTLHIALPPALQTERIRRRFRRLCQSPNFHLLASNHDMKQSLRSVVPEDFWQTIPVAHTGVNSEEILGVLNSPPEREKIIERYDLPADKFLIFSLANIIERKGFRVLLEAAKILQKTNAELFFVWIGDGERREAMQNSICDLGLEKSFKIVKPSEIGVERRDLLKLLRVADVFVHPSFAEGLPGALLEALALGVPIAASRVNAIPEAVTDGETGLLVEAGDAAGFARAIAKLSNDPELRRRLAKNGQAKVLANFTEEQCAAATLDFYQRCLRQS